MKLTLKRGLVLGVLVGIASAFLYAPKPGKELRAELRGRLNLVPKRLLDLLESIVDLTYSVFDFAKATIDEQGEKISCAVTSGLTAAKEKSEELKRKVLK